MHQERQPLPALNLTRRALLTGASAGAMLAAMPAMARRPFRRGGKGTPVAAEAGESLTFVNTAGSDSPAAHPLTYAMGFREGRVPSGSIAVPQIGGVDQMYQVDNVKYWGTDGSIKSFKLRVARSSALAAGASVQVTFDIRVGSYSNTSAITTADVTAATDYNIEIRNCHTAQLDYSSTSVVALTVNDGTGQISGAKVWWPTTLTRATANVENGDGTGGQVSVSTGTPTVVAPGSGYGYVGSGTFTAAFNDIITAIASGGNHANGVSIEQYAKGPICDAWRARTVVSGLNHFHVTFYVERWKKTDGTLLAYRAYAIYGTGLVSIGTTITNYTYDLDWKDGATVIRGATNADAGFVTMLNFVGSSGATFDDNALPDWSASGAAFNAITVERTPDEWDYFRSTGIILPWMYITSTVPVPSTLSAYSLGSSNSGISEVAVYQPFGNAGIRSALGAGGDGNQENPMTEVDGLHMLAGRAGDTADARIWRRNIRVSAAHSMSFAQEGGGLFEPTTLYTPNVIPASAQAFTGMTPTRETRFIQAIDIPDTGYTHPLIAGSQLSSYALSAADTYHQMCSTYGAAILEQEQWQLDALLYSATTPTFARSYSTRRQATLGATLYYGIFSGQITNVRVPTWWARSAGYAVSTYPETWADGTTAIEFANNDYCLRRHFEYLNDLIPFTGSVKMGSGGATVTKTVDFTGTGIWPENIATDLSGWAGSEAIVQFMDNYDAETTAHLGFLLKGSTTGNEIVAFRDYRKLYFVGMWDYAGSHYLNDGWRIKSLTGRPESTVADITWSNLGNVATPLMGIQMQSAPGSGGSQTYLTFTSGSSTVTVVDASGTPISIVFTPGVRLANGSRIQLTNTDLSVVNAIAVVGNRIPAGFDSTTWYYWNELSSTTGQLCTDAGLTTPVTPSESKTRVSMFVNPSNTLPADNSGLGTYQGGTATGGSSRISTKLGTLRLMKALDMDDTGASLTDAITNCAAIMAAIPGQTGTGYESRPQYAWGDTRFP
jgi:hypothetical protein